ncbi:MAG: hypothetical protein AAGC66_00200 [Leifsonia sp.]
MSITRKPTHSDTMEWDMAKTAMIEAGNWIKNADTKATILAAIFGVTLTALGSRVSDITTAYTQKPVIAAVVLTAALVALMLNGVGAAIRLGQALQPRHVSSNRPGNRFSWPDVAVAKSMPTRITHSQDGIDDAWETSRVLATIAAEKYRAFAAALRLFVGVLVSMVVIVTTIALPPAGTALSPGRHAPTHTAGVTPKPTATSAGIPIPKSQH